MEVCGTNQFVIQTEGPTLPELSRLEERLQRERFSDGSVDLIVAAALLALTHYFWWREPYGIILMGVAGPLAWRLLRRSVVEPRLGRVRPSALRAEKQRSAGRRIGVASAGALLLGVWIFLTLGGLEGRVPDFAREVRLPFGGLFAAFIALWGFSLGQVRVVAYGAVVLVAFLAAWPLGGYSALPMTLAAASGLVLALALLRLRRFLAAYPRLETDV